MNFIPPQIQEYYDPLNENPEECFAIRPDINQIIGKFALQNRYTRFYFPDGSVLNTVTQDELGIIFNVAEIGTLAYSDPYGEVLWGTKDGIHNWTGLASFNPYTTPWTIITEWGTPGASQIIINGISQNIPNPISFAVSTDNTYLIIGSNIQSLLSIIPISSSGGISPPTAILQTGDGTVLGNNYVTAGDNGVFYNVLSPLVIADNNVEIGVVNPPVYIPIRTYAPTDFNSNATQFSSFSSLAYDHTDGNVLAMIITNNSSGPSSTQYLCKFSTTDGTILWQTPMEIGPGTENAESFSQSIIENGKFYWCGYYLNNVGFTNLYVIDTSTGTPTIYQDTTLGSALSISNQISNDRIHGIIGIGNWNNTLGTIQLLNSTAGSRNSCLCAVYFTDEKTNPPDHVKFCDDEVVTE